MERRRQQFDPHGCHHHHDNSAHHIIQKAMLSSYPRMAYHVLLHASLSVLVSLSRGAAEGSQHSDGLSDGRFPDVELWSRWNDRHSLAGATEASTSLFDLCERFNGFGVC